eukprot:6292075-Amphidinium_carterae.1
MGRPHDSWYACTKTTCTGWVWQRRACCRKCGTPAPNWVWNRKAQSALGRGSADGAAERSNARQNAASWSKSREDRKPDLSKPAEDIRDGADEAMRKHLQQRIRKLEGSIKYLGEDAPAT